MLSISKLVVDPEQFFIDQSDLGLRAPVAIVVMASILNGIPPLILGELMTSVTDGSVSSFLGITVVFSSLSIVITTFGLWFVYSLVITYLSKGFGGTTTYRDVVKYSAFGYVPIIFAGIMACVLTFLMTQNLLVETDQSLQHIAAALESNPYTRSIRISKTLFILWQGVLWVFGIRHISKITLRKSVLTVTPVVTIALLLLWGSEIGALT